MRILYVVHGTIMDEANLALLDVLEEQKAKHKEIEAFVLWGYGQGQDSALKSRLESLGVHVLPFKFISTLIKLKERLCSINHIKGVAGIGRNFFYALRWGWAIKKLNMDLIYTNSNEIILGAFLGSILGIPHVFHVRESLEKSFGLKYAFSKRFNRYLYGRSKMVIFSSYALLSEKREFTRIGNGIILRDCIGEKKIKPREISPKTTHSILIAGTISENRGQMEALRAVHALLDKGYSMKLFIAGQVSSVEDPYYRAIMEYINKYRLQQHVFFTEYTDDIGQLRGRMDLELSCSRYEGFDRNILEAMLSKVLVVASRVPAADETVVDGYNGFLYTRGDWEALARKIGYAVEDFSLRRTLTSNAFAYACRNFSQQDYVETLVKSYRTILDSKPGVCAPKQADSMV